MQNSNELSYAPQNRDEALIVLHKIQDTEFNESTNIWVVIINKAPIHFINDGLKDPRLKQLMADINAEFPLSSSIRCISDDEVSLEEEKEEEDDDDPLDQFLTTYLLSNGKNGQINEHITLNINNVRRNINKDLQLILNPIEPPKPHNHVAVIKLLEDYTFKENDALAVYLFEPLELFLIKSENQAEILATLKEKTKPKTTEEKNTSPSFNLKIFMLKLALALIVLACIALIVALTADVSSIPVLGLIAAKLTHSAQIATTVAAGVVVGGSILVVLNSNLNTNCFTLFSCCKEPEKDDDLDPVHDNKI